MRPSSFKRTVMEITAQSVKNLREITGAGMMECKKALTESNGDADAAIEYLRKQGLKASAKKADRIATEGVIAINLSADGKAAVITEVNCETDFVARGDEFIQLASDVAGLVLEKSPADEAALLALTSGSETLADRITNLVAKIGEKMTVRRFERVTAKDGQKLGQYIHMGNKIGVVVLLSGGKADEALARDVAMHVAAIDPRYLSPSDIPAEIMAKEKEIALELLKSSGKPPEMLEKIVGGKVAKVTGEMCLNEQLFIKDPTGKNTVSKFLKSLDPTLKVESFVR